VTTGIHTSGDDDRPTADALDARRQRRRHDPEDKQQRLIAATFRTIERIGYTRATVQQICKDADVAIGTFYEHFENKAALLSHEATEDRVLRFSPGELDDPELIEANLRAFLHGSPGRLWRVWREALMAEPSLQPIEERLGALTRRDLRDSICQSRERAGLPTQPEEIEGIVWAILALVRDLFRRAAPHPDNVERALARAIWAIVHDGGRSRGSDAV